MLRIKFRKSTPSFQKLYFLSRKREAGRISPNVDSTTFHSLFISSYQMTDIKQNFKKQDCTNSTPKMFQEYLGGDNNESTFFLRKKFKQNMEAIF